MDNTKLHRDIRRLLTPIKYGLLLLLALYVSIDGKRSALIPGQVLEILFIFVLSDEICARSRVWGQVVSSMGCILITAQLLIFRFGSTYLSLVMVTNLFNLRDLTGSTAFYFSRIIPAMIVSLLPVKHVLGRRGISAAALAGIAAADIFLCCVVGMTSPMSAYISLAKQWNDHRRLAAEVSAGETDREAFSQSGIADGRERPDTLPLRPNVIVIFAEGLSQHIIDDERQIMPSVKYWESRSLSFSNYYNHTFATFRALIGQLYSGYQLNDTDENKLVSLQSVLHDCGYHTVFINTEPNHESFTRYLNAFGFDELIGEPGGTYRGASNSIPDKDAYDMLREAAEARSNENEPFFISIYTFGTHTSLDGVYSRFGDGSDPELNKFYDLDRSFRSFMDWFASSEFADNTVLVFTSDHATFADAFYRNSFPDQPRPYTELDSIPLFIYWSGAVSEVVDAGGRNSLDLVPTLLDFLDISAPNCFLGTSLFSADHAAFEADTYFHSVDSIACSKGGIVRDLSPSEFAEFSELLKRYFIAKSTADDITITRDSSSVLFGMETRVDPETGTLLLSLPLEGRYDQVWFALWSDIGAQDDLVWYAAERTDGGVWSRSVDLSSLEAEGYYTLHVYVEKDAETTFIGEKKLLYPGIS
ncbi:MAG: sulfatase-like hydrolase/transferase [Oscillospiraceae bacterium]|nr:sulfatase-like hydrolase/transferase [Oscillospiraceae bacterium]